MRHGCSFFLVAVVLLSPPAMAADANTVAVDGVAYVDIRSGFSMHLCRDWQLGAGDGAYEKAKVTGEREYPDLAGWDAIKAPSSKELVGFTSSAVDEVQYLTIYLLVLKRDLSLDEIVASRKQYWQKSPSKVIVTEGPALVKDQKIFSEPTSLLTILWRSDDKGAWEWLIREALVRGEAGRYFLLRWVKCAGEKKGQEDGKETIGQIVSSFVCLGETEVRRRWAQAIQKGQDLLTRWKKSEWKAEPLDHEYYRVMRGDSEIGFLVGQVDVPGATDPNGHKTVTTRYWCYVEDACGGREMAGMLGWATAAQRQEDKLRIFTGPITLSGKIVLDLGGTRETFDITVTASDDGRGYREQGVWTGNALSVKRFDDPAQPQKMTTAELEVKRDIYLPWSVWGGMGKLLDGKGEQEYVFMHYGNRALGHCTLRTAGQRPRETSFAHKDYIIRDTGPTTYIVAQMSGDGPIVESWYNAEGGGRLLARRSNGVTIERCDRSVVGEKWPKQLEKITSTADEKD